MEPEPAAYPTVKEVLRSFENTRRLIHLVRAMAKEMERLDEDNRQLRAAVGIYREVARRRGCAGGQDQAGEVVPIRMPRASGERQPGVTRPRPVSPENPAKGPLRVPPHESLPADPKA